MSLDWRYKQTEAFIPQGRDTTRGNFSREERSPVGILVREALQNPLDVPLDNLKGPIKLVLKRLQPGEFDASYLDEVFNAEFRGRFKAVSDKDLPLASQAEVIVIEDFGTKGLIGDVADYDADGDGQNWNAFWLREGQPSKQGASNGGAGQGKITYYDHSLARTVLGLTRRSTDSQELLMGRAFFTHDYRYRNQKFMKTAFWTASDCKPTPENNPALLHRFTQAFGLTRTSSDTGLSLVIPFAKAFDPTETMKSVILDFYMPIADKKLEVTVGSEIISSATIDGLADTLTPDAYVREAKSAFSKAYRAFARTIIESPPAKVTLATDWNKEVTIPDTVFPEGSLEKLRADLEAGLCIAIELPLKLKKKDRSEFDTTFEVYIEAPPDLDRVEEAFVRRQLLIGAERHIGAGAAVQKARSLTWIRDKALSDFLLSAEEPTHLVWNASLARDKGEYTSPDIALRSIRQAVPRLLKVLLGGDGKLDSKALARFFGKPATDETKKTGASKDTDKKGAKTTTAATPPPPVAKHFRIDPSGTVIRLLPSGSRKLEATQLPLRAKLEVAYEGLDGDPFDEYDPFDFDLRDTSAFPVTCTGLKVVERKNNRMEIEVVDPQFRLEVGGFDKNLRVRARLEYTLSAENGDEEQADLQDPEDSGEVEESNA